MPFYEYLCGACAHELEVLQKISEEPLVFCPECGEKTLKKQISMAAFRLKGTGWYETDFKDSGKKKSDDDKGDKKESGKDANKDSKSDSGKSKTADSGDSKSSSSKDSSSKSSNESKSGSTSNAA